MQRCHCNLTFNVLIQHRNHTKNSNTHECSLRVPVHSYAPFSWRPFRSHCRSKQPEFHQRLLRCAEYSAEHRFICPAQKPAPTPSLQKLLAMLLPKCPNAAERADRPSMRQLRPRRLANFLEATARVYLADPPYWPISCQGRG